MRLFRCLSLPCLLLSACGLAACGDGPRSGPSAPSDTAGPGIGDTDTGDTGSVSAPCAAPDVVLDSLIGEPGAEAGRSLVFSEGVEPALASGVPEGREGAGLVLLTAPDGLTAAGTLAATGVRTLGRSLAAGSGGGIAAAALAEDGTARIFWAPDPWTASEDLSLGPGYAAAGDGAGVSLAVGHGGAEAVLLVGLPRASSEGSVWVVPLPTEPDQPLAGLELWGEQASGYAGAVVRAVGDLDGDGVEDAAVGAFGVRGAGPLSGRLYLLQGPWVEGSVADAEGVVSGADGYDLLGWAVAGGPDLDGDGLSDVVVGAPGTNGADLSTGAAHVFVGPAEGALAPADAWSTVEGAEADTRLGWSVAALSGSPPRVAVGGPGHRTNGGAVWASEVTEGQMPLGEPVLESDGGAGAGGTLAAGGANASGCDLLAVGAPDGSRVWVLGGS